MRALLCSICLSLAMCLPAAVAAAQSWDVTVVSATGETQLLQGRTYRIPVHLPSPLFGRVISGGGVVDCIALTNMIRIGVQHSLVYGNSVATITIERPDAFQRYSPVCEALLKTAGPGQSFSGTVTASDGGTVAITVVANP